ncbi:hypothetical protein PFISCL1PPCAC_3717, partial [Pristionchus fissidentatus]
LECVVSMEDGEVCVPDIPLARVEEDDLDSNKNSDRSSSAGTMTDEEAAADAAKSNLNDDLSGSLEDLVGNFDRKINHCLRDLGESTEEMAPVVVRTQDEIMSESQLWWTLTGNFGTMLPLDVSQMKTRKLLVNSLDLNSARTDKSDIMSSLDGSEDEDLRNALDMHQLVAQGSPMSADSPPQTADQVIEEIDQMLSSCDFTGSMMTDRTMESVDSMYSSMRSPSGTYPGVCAMSSMMASSIPAEVDAKMRQAANITAHPENLRELSYSKLVQLHAEMEQLIQVYNESLVDELAHRDECEYEKEMKNTFISLLLSIQNKRRQYANDRKRKPGKMDVASLPQYMTASIPYNEQLRSMDNATICTLNKLLRAINEDSASVPTMLTEYILTVICPSGPKPISC